MKRVSTSGALSSRAGLRAEPDRAGPRSGRSAPPFAAGPRDPEEGLDHAQERHAEVDPRHEHVAATRASRRRRSRGRPADETRVRSRTPPHRCRVRRASGAPAAVAPAAGRRAFRRRAKGDPAAPGVELGHHARRIGLARGPSRGQGGVLLRGDVETRAPHLGPLRGGTAGRPRLGGSFIAVVLHGGMVSTAGGGVATAPASPDRQRGLGGRPGTLPSPKRDAGGGRGLGSPPRPRPRLRVASALGAGDPDRQPGGRRGALRGPAGAPGRARPAAIHPGVPQRDGRRRRIAVGGLR